eukprot:EG_transcript_5641
MPGDRPAAPPRAAQLRPPPPPPPPVTPPSLHRVPFQWARVVQHPGTSRDRRAAHPRAGDEGRLEGHSLFGLCVCAAVTLILLARRLRFRRGRPLATAGCATAVFAATSGERGGTSPGSARLSSVEHVVPVPQQLTPPKKRVPLDDANTVLCCLPPPEVWRHFQELRCTFDHDFATWPPQLILMRPFWSDRGRNLKRAAQLIARKLHGSPPLRVGLSPPTFDVLDRRCTLCVTPDSPGPEMVQKLVAEALDRVVEYKPGPREHRRYGAPFPYLVLGHFPDGQAATEVARRLEPLWRPVVWYTDELAILTRPGPLQPAVVRYRIKFSRRAPDRVNLPYVATVGDDGGLARLLAMSPDDVKTALYYHNLQRLRDRSRPAPDPFAALLDPSARLGPPSLSLALPPAPPTTTPAPVGDGAAASGGDDMSFEATFPPATSDLGPPISRDHHPITPITEGLGKWPDGVWVFVYDEYLDHYLLQEESGIAPKRSVRAALPGWTLCFDAVGGAASVVPLDSPEAAMFPMFADGVHGVLHLLPFEHYTQWLDLRVCFKPVEVWAQPLEGADPTPCQAVVLQVLPDRRTRPGLPAPEQLRDRIATSAEAWDLDERYVEWLWRLPTLPDTFRGPEYWARPRGDRIKFNVNRGPTSKVVTASFRDLLFQFVMDPRKMSKIRRNGDIVIE